VAEIPLGARQSLLLVGPRNVDVPARAGPLEEPLGLEQYLRLDQLKGCRPICRGRLAIDATPHGFDNPVAARE
jgi:hypothetical protein